MQEQVAVDALYFTQARHVAGHAADIREESPAIAHCTAALGTFWINHDRRRQCPDVRDKCIAVGFGHVDSLGFGVRSQGRSGLGVATNLQTQLIRARGPDELVQACDLCLPAETPDAAVGLAADPAARGSRLALRGRDHHVRRNRVYAAQAEQRRRVPLGKGQIGVPGGLDTHNPSVTPAV